MRVFYDFIHIKIKVGKHINFIYDERIANCKDQRVLERLVMSLRHGKNHDVFHRSRIEASRADEIAHVFQYDEIIVFRSNLV